MLHRLKSLSLIGLFGLSSLGAYQCDRYVGGAFGLASNIGRFTTASTSDSIFAERSFILNNDSSSRAQEIIGWGELYAGVGFTLCNHMYLGPRLGVNFSSFDVKQNLHFDLEHVAPPIPPGIRISDSIDTEQRGKLNPVEFTLDGKFGFFLCPNTLIYGLVGIAVNRPEIQFRSIATTSQQFEQAPIVTTVPLREKQTGNWAHLRWGVGLEQWLSRCISLNILYTQTCYGFARVTATGSDVVTPKFDETIFTSSGKARLSKQVISVGISYHF